MKHSSTFENELAVLRAISTQTGHPVNISPKTLNLENNLMMLFMLFRHVSVVFVFAADSLLGSGCGGRGNGADTCKNRVHWQATLLVSTQRP